MNESLGRAPHLLSDAPLDRILDNEDFARGKPVVDALFSHLEQYFFERQRHRGQGFCIGLFGGLGQGKTTIVQSLEARMRRANFNIGFLGDGLGYNPVFTWFVASDYSTTELDAELDRCLSQMLWTWRVLVTAVVFGVGYHAINVVSALAEKANWLHSPASLASMVIVALTLLGAGVNFLFPKFLRQLERWMHFGAHRRRRFRLRRADVLVIDDLDRATVDQQRALLRSLYRYSAQFNCAVIVCLDETQLLASPPTPDAPEELLRKAIAVECRMPNRTDDDGPFLAMALTSKAAQLNPHIDWLRDPVFLADFSRVCALLPRTGPRQIKRLLNDLLWAMHQIGSRDSLSASALLRANGLAYFVPALRTQATSFINLLQENNTGRFGEFLRTLEVSVATTPSNTAHIAAAIRLFAATRALLPESGDWRQAIAVWPNQVSRGAMPCASPEVESKAEIAIPLPLTYDEVAGLSKTFRLIAQGYGDAQFYDRSLTLAVNP